MEKIDTIKKWGNGNAIRITKDLLLVAQFSESEPIEITATKGQIVIVKRNRKTVQELLEDYDGFYEPNKEGQEWLDMKPVGEEIK
ncbi:AbrB/MazE/SpoVT family DNA-binding domain-containing protein [Enterococcus timonensis]|uniref:AbrB/MazE/SpoVT family DNA-binding domain-containing protein n=1 Tax=Enterococcus timonensis TaxID=1852364 RepID=UPI0008DA0277|nr:hypothetical protein [Enterococcus timonensis]